MNIPQKAEKPAEQKILFHSGAHKRRALRAYDRTMRKRQAKAEAGQVQIDRGLRLSARQVAAFAAWTKTDEGKAAIAESESQAG